MLGAHYDDHHRHAIAGVAISMDRIGVIGSAGPGEAGAEARSADSVRSLGAKNSASSAHHSAIVSTPP